MKFQPIEPYEKAIYWERDGNLQEIAKVLEKPEARVKTKWREVCKFLSGAFFVSAGILFYLYITGTPIPLIGTHFMVGPGVNGLRSIIHAILFLVTFYFGFIRK